LPDDLFEGLILGIRVSEHITHDEITARFFRKAGEIHIMRSNGISTDRPYTPPVTITIDAIDMARAAQTLKDELSEAEIAVLIDALLG